ncbi:hypothetical protein PHSY_004401 [Pseudozyma hubeiensis SY62]|uniref:Lipase B n=1 Tax=Pseudozyma hubeiensis (strain SY62) TaxID=1305764 RepID=R9P6G8_PSEHS|nr:hypothetical protein PHSY_004401 [Pseudozyma hubeiensis SY62]GAC96817.1 hypothetical protein PHSY_004401 [Pseudozyma hubeiensis SY62]
MKTIPFVSALIVVLSVVTATPLLSLPRPSSDPPITTPKSVLDRGLECQTGSPSRQTRPILLVPGTGVTGQQSFASNWIPLSTLLGYSPCWISPPPFMLNDSQINSEYIVNAVHTLYSGSGGKVPVVTWSQGGLAVQWALTFFPSIRGKVDRLMAFAPDYKGTVEAGLLSTFGLAAESVWQQQAGSAFLTALKNAGGLTRIVPTTNLYSSVDEIVQPQFTNSPVDSSYLDNSMNVQMQQICGGGFIVDHAGSLTSQFSWMVGRSALGSKTGEAVSGEFGKQDCNATAAEPLSAQQKSDAGGLLLVAAGNLLGGPKVKCEPDLMEYARKYATGMKTCSGVIM